jgi:hypothetical protein
VTPARCRQFLHISLAYRFAATVWPVARRKERPEVT